MPDKDRSKLNAAKEMWAATGRALTGRTADPDQERLPPGQRLTKDWPVLDLGIVPNVAPGDWKLGVGGAVENTLVWTWDDFMAQPQTTLTVDMHCVTTWSRYDNTFVGVSARHLLGVVKPRPEAAFVMLRSHDGYTTNLPLSEFARDDVLLVHTWEGAPLTAEHGGPVRVIVPKLYLWKSAKWVRHITFMEKDQPGYWEMRGYHNNGDPWKEERYG